MSSFTNDAVPDNGGDATATSPIQIAFDLLKLSGLEAVGAERVTFAGPQTVLPSSYRVTDAAQALVAAVCSAIGAVSELRSMTQSPPHVLVDSMQSAAAFQSERHLRLDAPAELWDDLAGHYETSDGHIQFHTNFAHHRQALLQAVGCQADADRDQVATIVAQTDRFTLEQRVSEAGGIAAALRSAQEWSDHPHRRHVADRPPLTVERIGDSMASVLGPPGTDRPLAGVRVLDFTRVIAGPVCTRTLAAYGAEVLRIGAPELPVVDSILPDTTLGKKFANCDITTAEGRDTVLGLAAEADVVVTGFRPGALAGYGVGSEDLLHANPSLVIATLSAFGTDGPWGGKRGFDSITQTATGVVATEMQAYDSDKPRSLPCQLLDHGSGFLLALGVLGALVARHHTGGSYAVEASLLTTRNWLEALGPADPQAGKGLTPDEVAPFMETRQSDYGTVNHVAHPGTIEGFPARWERGPTRPGADAAAWDR